MGKGLRTHVRLVTWASSLLLASVSAPVPLLAPASAGSSCGVWRWDVKTLSDSDRKDVDFHERRIKIDQLRNLDAPTSLSTDTPRLSGIEKQVYEIRAQVITATIEDDRDIHLVIASRTAKKHTMIVEFPDPNCVDSPFKRDRMGHARQSLLSNCGSISSSSFTDLKGKVVIEGVGFWDEIHGQTGVAPNGIELHPVLSITGTCSKDSGGGGGGGGNCDAAYPTVCIPSPPPDLDCADIPYTNFTVLAPDPHHFDGDGDGIGCEA
jgi:hypothetical protein